jgi:hypothetical protein
MDAEAIGDPDTGMRDNGNAVEIALDTRSPPEEGRFRHIFADAQERLG